MTQARGCLFFLGLGLLGVVNASLLVRPYWGHYLVDYSSPVESLLILAGGLAAAVVEFLIFLLIVHLVYKAKGGRP